MRANLDMGKEADKLILWRKLTCVLQTLYNNKEANKELNKTNEPDRKVRKCRILTGSAKTSC